MRNKKTYRGKSLNQLVKVLKRKPQNNYKYPLFWTCPPKKKKFTNSTNYQLNQLNNYQKYLSTEKYLDNRHEYLRK